VTDATYAQRMQIVYARSLAARESNRRNEMPTIHDLAQDMLEQVRLLEGEASIQERQLDKEAGGALNQDLATVWTAVGVLCKAIVALRNEESVYRTQAYNLNLDQAR
jgi:hypothetical protein